MADNTKALDIGCGTGFRTSVLSKQFDVVGIDIDEKNINTCRQRYPEISFTIMNAENLGFPNDSLDLIQAIDVLEHVDDLEKVLYEINRVLKDDGILRIVIPTKKSEELLLKIRPSYHKEIHHVRIFEENELPEILLDHGFVCINNQKTDFIKLLELIVVFKLVKKSDTQLSIGDFRKNKLYFFFHLLILTTDPFWVFNSKLVLFPVWIITLPIGLLVNYFGNKIYPKSVDLEFKKLPSRKLE